MNMHNHHAIDNTWFRALLDISKQIGETYIALEPSREYLEHSRQLFELSNFRQDIPLFPDTMDTGRLRTAAAALSQLKAAIKEEERNNFAREAYCDYIDNLSANVRMIIAAHQQNGPVFEHENIVLYGQPDRQIFNAVCSWIRAKANDSLSTPGAERSRAETVLSLIPKHDRPYHMLTPSETVFHQVRQSHRAPHSYYDQLFGHGGLPTKPYIEQLEGDKICAEVLQNIGSDYTLAPSKNNIWATVREKKLLLRPLGYRLDTDEFTGIISHEIGSHILEATNGAKQPLRLLEIGLAGYEKGNEGRAFLREQIVYDKESTFLQQFAWEYIIMLHLAVCLAIGYDEQPYSFSKLYAVLFALYLLWREHRYPFETNNEAYARQEAWYLAVRIMKGTDGKNGAYRKDIVYLEGNIKCWQLATTNPQAILDGDIGKFDITNNNHLALLRQLGILNC